MALSGAFSGLFAPAAEMQRVSSLFLRVLALIYFSAFASLAFQIAGLAGPEGILPFADRLPVYRAELGNLAYLKYPTVFWISASDTALVGVTVAGCLLSVLLLFNIRPRAVLIGLFVLYLSLFHAGQMFMNFQWDYLLLEAGFLAIFIPGGPSRLVVWLFHWLLFRLRFLSGASKLITGDTSWSEFTALEYYFETQPLPHTGAWFAHQLPDGILMAGVVFVLFAELLIPWLMFLPRRWRLFAAWTTLLTQALIIATSNHNFFN
ncbi:MAG: lipase maturation factor family protein, partial [Pseudomonadota bacterium]